MDQTKAGNISFVGLFKRHAKLRVKEPQRQFLGEVLQYAQASGLRVWRPGDSIASQGRRILLGVVPWSRYDMEALDAVGKDLRGARVDIFIVDECKSEAEIEEFVPGVGAVFQTPVVGIWDDGQLVDKAWGLEGRQLLARYGYSPG
jgi:hypothetical protein